MTGWFLAAAVVLLLANAFFVAMEFALISARRTKIESLAAEGNQTASAALRSIRELSFMLAGAQLGITMASLGLGFVAEPAVARIIETGLEELVDLPPALVHSLAVVVALTIVVFLHMVIGEMAPKNIAIAEPERSALWLAIPSRVYATLFRPFIHLLNGTANAGLRLLRVEPQDELRAVHTAGEIGAIVAHSARSGMLTHFEERLLSGAIELGERDAGAAMIPRTEIKAVPQSATPADVEQMVLETGHSRFPVYDGDLDNIIGFVHAKDLLRLDPARRDQALVPHLTRQMIVVPESRKLRALLLDMRRERRHVALVIDEHGGTAGIVTLEDLIEELVGDIRDEYDEAEMGIEQVGEARYLVPGSLRIDEARSRIGVDLPAGDYDTIAGFLMDRLGRVPRRRDAVVQDGWRLRVRAMYRRKVIQVLVEPAGHGSRNP